MPIFEYLCPACNRIYSFLSLRPDPTRQPVCPKCGAGDLRRVPSAFAVARGAAEGAKRAGADEPGGGEAPSPALEREMMQMVSQLDEKDAEDPRVMARLMRRLSEASGERVTPAMEEMFRRMEAGEDPEALEEELGPRLEEEMGDEGGDEGGPPAPDRDPGLYGL